MGQQEWVSSQLTAVVFLGDLEQSNFKFGVFFIHARDLVYPREVLTPKGSRQ